MVSDLPIYFSRSVSQAFVTTAGKMYTARDNKIKSIFFMSFIIYGD
jgi:hypothetical protein